MDQFKLAIAQQISAICDVPVESLVTCVEEPKNKTPNADLAFPIPKLNKFKKVQGNPATIAAEWKEKIVPNNLILGVVADGQYLNFAINRQIIVQQVVKQVLESGESWGTSKEGEGKHVIVEFSSPNMAKPFHAGHLRSTIIGNFLKNAHKALGYKVTSINYLGDWGKQYGLLAVGYKLFGNEEDLVANPIQHLYKVYVEINKKAEEDPTIHDQARTYFKRMEDGDPEALGLWKRFRDLSIVEYKQIYARLNVEFDVYSGESLQSEGMTKQLQILEEKKLLVEDKGAKLIDLEKFKLNKVLVTKSDGATLYITRDIAAAVGRNEEYNFDKMIYVVAAQQDLHFQQLFKTLDLMGYEWGKKCHHVNFGMVKGMSTRRGTVVFLEDILNEAKQSMLSVMQSEGNKEKFAEIENPDEVADLVGLSAVVVQDFAAKRVRDYDFNWSRMTSFEGYTGPYLQYQHARLMSMERKSGVKINKDADLSLLTEPVAQDIAQTISKFPQVIKQSMTTLEPVVLIEYLFQLAGEISSAHRVLWVKDREQSLAEARMALFWAARVTLGNGLKIIGLKPLERM